METSDAIALVALLVSILTAGHSFYISRRQGALFGLSLAVTERMDEVTGLTDLHIGKAFNTGQSPLRLDRLYVSYKNGVEEEHSFVTYYDPKLDSIEKRLSSVPAWELEIENYRRNRFRLTREVELRTNEAIELRLTITAAYVMAQEHGGIKGIKILDNIGRVYKVRASRAFRKLNNAYTSQQK